MHKACPGSRPIISLIALGRPRKCVVAFPVISETLPPYSD